MWSATFPREIQTLAREFLRSDHISLSVGRVNSTTELVTQKFLRMKDFEKTNKLIEILHEEKGGVLVFCQTKREVDRLQDLLLDKDFQVKSIHGDKTQDQRQAALNAFKNGQTRILLATNVAARGLDIKNVAQVINWEMPLDIDDYVHRIGRTGRAGKSGVAVTFITEKENPIMIRKLAECLEEANLEVPSWFNDVAKSNSPPRSRSGKFQGRQGNNYSRDRSQSQSSGFSSFFKGRNNNREEGSNRQNRQPLSKLFESMNK